MIIGVIQNFFEMALESGVHDMALPSGARARAGMKTRARTSSNFEVRWYSGRESVMLSVTVSAAHERN
jgi:hypothetical protein